MRIPDKNGIKMRVPINFDDFDELNIDRKTENGKSVYRSVKHNQ